MSTVGITLKKWGKKEILYRAKMKDNSEWVYGYYIKYSKYIHKIKPIDKDGNALLGECNIDINTLCEYTDLTDKNGVRIFECDIVRFSHPACEKSIEGFVVWLQDDLGFDLRTYDNQMTECGLGYSGEFYEVIGNIYDNPELLEGNDD